MSLSSSGRTNGQVVHDVITHWFGSIDIPRYGTLKAQYPLWYSGTKEIDDDIRNQFGKEVEMALNGELDHLIGSTEYPIKADLAMVVLLDQYSRNIYRGTAKAFAGDEKSRDIVMKLLQPDRWSQAKEMLPPAVRMTFALPLMHQESLGDLDRCIEFTKEHIQECLEGGAEGAECAEQMEGSLSFAESHREIVAKFGRYPYRNEVLGRQSTPEELEFLENGPRFGQ